MTNSTQELHATDCSAQRKTTQISAKYANKYTQNMGLATAGAKMNGKTRDFYDEHPRFNEKTRHSHKQLSNNTVKLH